jgi:hypothetical protein
MSEYDFDPSDWEDKRFKLRLNSGNGRWKKFGLTYEELCELFQEICSYVIIIEAPFLKEPYMDMASTVKRLKYTELLRKWCVANCAGWWMDRDFPDLTAAEQLVPRIWGFEREQDAVLFKLRWAEYREA